MVIPPFHLGCKPTLVPTGLKAYCLEDEYYILANRGSGPKKGLVMCNGIGIADRDYYENIDNDGHIYFQYYNMLEHDIIIHKGDPIGQIVFQKYLLVDNDNTEGIRVGGFGSTDKK